MLALIPNFYVSNGNNLQVKGITHNSLEAQRRLLATCHDRTTIGTLQARCTSDWTNKKYHTNFYFSWRTLRGVKVLRINNKHNVLWTLGVGIPGETGAMCYLFDTVLPLRKHKTAPPFPTSLTAEDLPLEYYDDSVHRFEEPTIAYEEV